MGNKRDCNTCKGRHEAPTGKGCKRTKPGYGTSTTTKSPLGSRSSSEDDDVLTQEEIVAVLKAQNKLLQLEMNEVLAKQIEAEQKAKEGKHGDNELTETLKQLTTELATMKADISELKTNSRDVSPARSEEGSMTGATKNDNGAVNPLFEQFKALLGANDNAQGATGISGTKVTDSDNTTKGKTLKSGADQTAIDKIVKEVPWPHMRVYDNESDKDDQGTKYSELSIEEFVFGYFMQARECTDSVLQEQLYSHFEVLLEDIKDYPEDWESIRYYHKQVLLNIEHGKMDWHQTDKIQTLRSKHVWGNKKRAKKQPCADFNKGKCSYKWDHKQWKHACAFCWSMGKGSHPHPQIECKRLGNKKRWEDTKPPGK